MQITVPSKRGEVVRTIHTSGYTVRNNSYGIRARYKSRGMEKNNRELREKRMHGKEGGR